MIPEKEEDKCANEEYITGLCYAGLGRWPETEATIDRLNKKTSLRAVSSLYIASLRLLLLAHQHHIKEVMNDYKSKYLANVKAEIGNYFAYDCDRFLAELATVLEDAGDQADSERIKRDREQLRSRFLQAQSRESTTFR